MKKETTYTINYLDKINVEVGLSIYIKQLKKEIKQMNKSINDNLSIIKNLESTKLKILGYYGCEEEPKIYDEKLKGVWGDIK